jgi:hypothetical protein
MNINSSKLIVLIVPALLLVAGIGYATKDKGSKPIETPKTIGQHVTVTEQRAVMVSPPNMSSSFLPADSGDTIIGVEVGWGAFSAGGIACSSATYSMSGSAGEVTAGDCSSAQYGVSQGFVQVVDESCCGVAGDANGDGDANVGDAVFLINYVFKSGAAPECLAEGDANCDGGANVGDAVYLINYVFKGGPAPMATCCP